MQKSKIFFSRDYWICIQLIISHEKYILCEIHTFHKNVRWLSGLRRDEAGGVSEVSQVRIPVGTQFFFIPYFVQKIILTKIANQGNFFEKFDSTSL